MENTNSLVSVNVHCCSLFPKIFHSAAVCRFPLGLGLYVEVDQWKYLSHSIKIEDDKGKNNEI